MRVYSGTGRGLRLCDQRLVLFSVGEPSRYSFVLTMGRRCVPIPAAFIARGCAVPSVSMASR